MALIKELTIPSGHTCYYWKIISINRDPLQPTSTIRIAGFLDKDSRDSNKPMLSDSIKTYEGFTGNSLEEAYIWLKEKYSYVSNPPIQNPNYDPTDPSSPYLIITDPLKVFGEFSDAEDA